MTLHTLELCCCAGGMALGFRGAGIEIETAVDFNSDACDSYEANLGHRPIQMDVRDLLRLGWEPRERIDLLIADPPCTPWSRAGKRQGLADERDLLRETVELIRKLRPVAFLIGNVPGLDDGSNRNVVQTVIGSLWRDGYAVDYAKLDAADYGVPQHRIRPFWFGRPRASEPLVWPAPSHCDPVDLLTRNLAGPELRPWVTCRDALGHLPPEQLGRPLRLKWKAKTDHKPNAPDEPARTLTGHGNSDGHLLAVADEQTRKSRTWSNAYPPSELDLPARTITASPKRSGHSGAGAAVLVAKQVSKKHPPSHPEKPSNTVTAGGSKHQTNTLEWPWLRPATTVTADPNGRIAPPGHHEKSFLSDNRGHGPNAVALSERAAAILQGFPESATFCGKSKSARWKQIGMAMPPPLAEVVACSIVRWFVSHTDALTAQNLRTNAPSARGML